MLILLVAQSEHREAVRTTRIHTCCETLPCVIGYRSHWSGDQEGSTNDQQQICLTIPSVKLTSFGSTGEGSHQSFTGCEPRQEDSHERLQGLQKRFESCQRIGEYHRNVGKVRQVSWCRERLVVMLCRNSAIGSTRQAIRNLFHLILPGLWRAPPYSTYSVSPPDAIPWQMQSPK